MTESARKTLQVRFFARLREDIGQAQLEFPLASPAELTVDDVRRSLVASSKAFTPLSGTGIHCAVNQVISRLDAPVRAGDEVAFFPPVTGG